MRHTWSLNMYIKGHWSDLSYKSMVRWIRSLSIIFLLISTCSSSAMVKPCQQNPLYSVFKTVIFFHFQAIAYWKGHCSTLKIVILNTAYILVIKDCHLPLKWRTSFFSKYNKYFKQQLLLKKILMNLLFRIVFPWEILTL